MYELTPLLPYMEFLALLSLLLQIEILSNESVKPSKLMRSQSTKHDATILTIIVSF